MSVEGGHLQSHSQNPHFMSCPVPHLHSSQVSQAVAERVTINRDCHLHPGMWKLGLDWGARTELIKENDIGN